MSPRIVPCLLLALLAGCASSADSAAARDYTLRPGESITLADHATLTYTGVAQDSRCPPKVQCIHAGSAQVQLNYRQGEQAREITWNTDGDTATSVGDRRLQLLDLAHGASPALTVRVERTH